MKAYIVLLVFGTLIFAGSLGVIVFLTNPKEAPFPILYLFYFSILGTATGFFSLIGYAIRRTILDKEKVMKVALRQGFFLGLIAAVALYLQSKKQLDFKKSIIIALVFIGVELWITRILNSRQSNN